MKTDQQFVDRIIARAQNSMMSLGECESNHGYDLSQYADPNMESVALLLVTCHTSKYDLVSLMLAAMEEVELRARQQGYTEAAELVRVQPIHSDFNLGHPEGARMMADKIERKRDNLKMP